MKKDKSIPTLLAYRDGGQLVVWCPYCCDFHRHGAGTDGIRGSADGHRCAHCGSSSNISNSGYYVQEMTKAQMKSIKKSLEDALDSYGW